MKRFILLAGVLAACQPSNEAAENPTEEKPVEQAVAPKPEISIEPGVVRMRLKEPVSEPRACIIPIRIENGLEDETRVTMISFDLTGAGNDAKGNMFAPAAAAGGFSEARVIVEGQSCAAFDTITIPELRCTSGDESCEGKIELIDGQSLRFSQTG